jgi:DNA-binding CsgD family transcriptional regulator
MSSDDSSSDPAAPHQGSVRRPLSLREALDAVLNGRELDVPVRDEILDSWSRSAASSLQPDQMEVPYAPDIDDDALLIRAASPVLDVLVNDLGDARIAILLTDEHGHVVDRRVGDPGLAIALDRIQLARGFLYSEDTLGTNGIGTTLAAHKPTAVQGEEHYAEALTAMACAAAPIVDPGSGRMVGVIDLTAFAADGSPHMLPLAIRSARDVQERLLDDAGVTKRLVLQRFLDERRRAKTPMLILTDAGIMTNTAAARLIDGTDEALLREFAAALTVGQPARGQLQLTGGTAVMVHGEPILDGAVRLGAVLHLEALASAAGPRGPERGGRPTFGWASLTDAERAVAELVADGLTNREAGERLYLSRHTVGFHLRAIFRKLDVASRVELTRMVTERNASGE